MDSFASPKDEIWFLRVCHHISNAVTYFTTQLPVCALRNKHLHKWHFTVQFSMVSSVSRKLATCRPVSWAALNGATGGQHRCVSLYSVTSTSPSKLTTQDAHSEISVNTCNAVLWRKSLNWRGFYYRHWKQIFLFSETSWPALGATKPLNQ
jgi:hypothetical protein